MRRPFSNVTGLLSAAALSLGISAPAALVKADPLEAKIYGVTKWDGGCSGSQRDYWDDMARAWYDEIGASSWYYKKFNHTNGSINSQRFADSSLVSWGSDPYYVDDADAALLFWHGAESGDIYRGSMRIPNTSNGNSCRIQRDQMQLGDSDLEFLALSSCQSMDDNQWKSWWQAFNGLHQVDGFHGLMWIGSGMVDDYEDFADDAFDDSIADAWLDNMYRPNISGSDDQCPVAYGVGNGSNDLWNRIGNERYNNIYSDPVTYTRWGAVFIGGCDPAAETVINSDTNS
jgi:hypothetical protein